MGAALIQGWITANLIKRADILDPNGIPDSLTNFQSLFHVKQAADLSFSDSDAESDLLILAVKPQIMDSVCADLKPILPPTLPILSIAAGKTTNYFQTQFSNGTPIIRAMPNTPAAIGKGMSALYATDAVKIDTKKMAETLLNTSGQTLWLENEDQMDAVTAVSGSGPAYIFHIIETLAQAGIKAGLSDAQAMQLARQTVIGSAALAAHEEDTPAHVLRKNVTSPGGTTEAALNVLMDGRLQDIMNQAVESAKKRGQELAV